MENPKSAGTRRLTGLGLFAGIVVALQLIGTFVKIGAFPVSLVLIPIVVGGAVYGIGGGALLGTFFGVFVTLTCILGWDQGGYILWSAAPLKTAILCIGKGAAAGTGAACAYRALRKYPTAATAAAAAVAPILNTGLFCVGMFAFFKETLVQWAGGANVVYYALTGLAGINFLIEFFINLVLCPTIQRIILIGKRRRL